jgi:hypothetical protein
MLVGHCDSSHTVILQNLGIFYKATTELLINITNR